MKQDHIALLRVEQLAADAGKTVQLVQDLNQVFTPPIRLMIQAYEEDFYSCASQPGSHVISGLLRTLPDNKLVEDLHSVLRNDARTQKTKRQSLHHMMELVTQSNQLSSREVPHKPVVNRPVFLEAFPRTKDQKRRRRPLFKKQQVGCNVVFESDCLHSIAQHYSVAG